MPKPAKHKATSKRAVFMGRSSSIEQGDTALILRSLVGAQCLERGLDEGSVQYFLARDNAFERAFGAEEGEVLVEAGPVRLAVGIAPGRRHLPKDRGIGGLGELHERRNHRI